MVGSRQGGNMTNKRLINFLRYIKKDNEVSAVEMINAELDKGVDLDLILKKDSDGFGYSLYARKISGDKYIIELGFQAGPLAGDGGEWEVTFDGYDKVVECISESTWIS